MSDFGYTPEIVPTGRQVFDSPDREVRSVLNGAIKRQNVINQELARQTIISNSTITNLQTEVEDAISALQTNPFESTPTITSSFNDFFEASPTGWTKSLITSHDAVFDGLQLWIYNAINAGTSIMYKTGPTAPFTVEAKLRVNSGIGAGIYYGGTGGARFNVFVNDQLSVSTTDGAGSTSSTIVSPAANIFKNPNGNWFYIRIVYNSVSSVSVDVGNEFRKIRAVSNHNPSAQVAGGAARLGFVWTGAAGQTYSTSCQYIRLVST